MFDLVVVEAFDNIYAYFTLVILVNVENVYMNAITIVSLLLHGVECLGD